MEKKGNIIAAVGIMIGLIAIALAITASVDNFTSYNRTVTVKGLCEREVRADRVIWPIVYKEGGNDLKGVYANLTAKNATIVKWLKEAGIEESEITISAPSVEDVRTYSYTVENHTYNYIVTQVITICTNNVDTVLSLRARQSDLFDLGIAIGSGSSWENPVVFEYTGLNDIKPEMIEEATKNARISADKFAKDSDSRIGKIVTASQGQVSVADRDANTPYIKTIRVVTTIQYMLKD